jgi:hypothetical protein
MWGSRPGSCVHVFHQQSTNVVSPWDVVVHLILYGLRVDSSSVYLVKEQGWQKIFSSDMNELHYGQYAQEQAAYAAQGKAVAAEEKMSD